MIIGVLIGLVVGGGGVFALISMSAKSTVARARTEAQQLVDNARREAENRAKEIELAAKQEQLKAKEKFERENEQSRRKLDEHEQRLAAMQDPPRDVPGPPPL
jgi:ribonuclease Y